MERLEGLRVTKYKQTTMKRNVAYADAYILFMLVS